MQTKLIGAPFNIHQAKKSTCGCVCVCVFLMVHFFLLFFSPLLLLVVVTFYINFVLYIVQASAASAAAWTVSELRRRSVETWQATTLRQAKEKKVPIGQRIRTQEQRRAFLSRGALAELLLLSLSLSRSFMFASSLLIAAVPQVPRCPRQDSPSGPTPAPALPHAAICAAAEPPRRPPCSRTPPAPLS